MISIPALHSWNTAPRYSTRKVGSPHLQIPQEPSLQYLHGGLLRYMKMRREQVEMHLDIYSYAMLFSEVFTVQVPFANIAESKGTFSTGVDTSFE
jgi:hypothetical protein